MYRHCMSKYFAYGLVIFAPEFKAINKHNLCGLGDSLAKMLQFSSIVGLLFFHFHLQQIHGQLLVTNSYFHDIHTLHSKR